MSFKTKIQNILNDFSNSTFNVINKLESDSFNYEDNINNLNINHLRRKSHNFSRNNTIYNFKNNNSNNIIINSYEIKKYRSKSIKKIHDLKNIIDDEDYKNKKITLKTFMNNYKNLNTNIINSINKNKNNEINHFIHYLNNNSSYKIESNNKLIKNLSFLKQKYFNKNSKKNKIHINIENKENINITNNKNLNNISQNFYYNFKNIKNNDSIKKSKINYFYNTSNLLKYK